MFLFLFKFYPEILEQREVAVQLGNLVRDKILQKLHSLGEGREYLEELFRAIDTNNSDLLSRAEFKIFCTEMSISFSNKRWRQIFREIDKNGDNEISFDELFLFLYPDSQTAKDKENERIQKLEMNMINQELKNRKEHHYVAELNAVDRISTKLRKGNKDKRVSLVKTHINSMRAGTFKANLDEDETIDIETSSVKTKPVTILYKNDK